MGNEPGTVSPAAQQNSIAVVDFSERVSATRVTVSVRRVTFRFEGPDAVDVDYEEYH